MRPLKKDSGPGVCGSPGPVALAEPHTANTRTVVINMRRIASPRRKGGYGGKPRFPSVRLPGDLQLAVDLRALLLELLRFLLHAALQRIGLREPLLNRVLAHV